MKFLIYFLIGGGIFLSACEQKGKHFSGAVAYWSFSDENDLTIDNSQLREKGSLQWVKLDGDALRESRQRGGDGKAVKLDGSGWLDAVQGANDELNITGKQITIAIRVKADSLKELNPVITKSGDDQSIAYSLTLVKKGEDVFIQSMIGSDDIGGAHLLNYKLPEEEWYNWHDIVFRFNGRVSELYVDGLLRDDEITVGEIRDWNRRPVLIGAVYNSSDGYVPGADYTPAATFIGMIDEAGIWNRYLEDKDVALFSGVRELKDGKPVYYQEKYRPQFHFTAQKNWLNDPNGLFYYEGVYHLFYQYMPPHRPGAYKDWGHAISKDLVHWEQIPYPITPHKVWAGCWSGSAVVDHHNVSGFQSGEQKPIIAFITNGGNPGDGIGPLCTQCIAYSTDGGKTFTYYDQNPVIKNIHGANRDPKVVWDEDSKKWIMSIYMDRGYEFGLFSSDNLRDWEALSTISLDRLAECPGFEPFPLDGDKNNRKWVFSGANGNYVVGTFNGKEFKPETGTLIGDYGNNLYAPQIWDNAPEDRKIQIGWLATNKYPGMPFEQQMNFPTEMELKTTPEGIRLFRMPVREIKNLHDTEISIQKTISGGDENPLSELKGDLYDFDMEIDVTKCRAFRMELRGAVIRYDAVNRLLSCGGPAEKNRFTPESWRAYTRKNENETNNMGEATLKPDSGKIKLRILVDRTTVEIYANDGLVVMTSCFRPNDTKWYALSAEGEIGVNAAVHSLKSAWVK